MRDVNEIEHIFRAYDIRGVVGQDLYPEIVTRIGAAFGTYIGKGTIAIAYDTRTSSIMFEQAFTSGVLSTGVSVIKLGLLPIPALNFYLLSNTNLSGGVMITASHNPPEYNGIRFRRTDGTGFTEENEKIKKIFYSTSKITMANWYQLGTVYMEDITRLIDRYVAFVSKKLKFSNENLRIVIDCGNGAASTFAPYVFRKLGLSIITVNCYPDGTFSSRPSDPLKGDLSVLKSAVLKYNASFGVAYDGDADRVVFIDEKGQLIPPEISGAIFAKYIISKGIGKTIVANVSCSMCVDDVVNGLGGTVVRSKVGDVFVAEKCKETNAVLGVESSAHYFFPAYGLPYDDGIFGSLLMAEIISESEKALSELASEIPMYYTYTTNIDCPDRYKFEVVRQLIQRLSEQGEQILTLDGLKIITDSGWVLIRPSNTEPLIRVAIEGRDEQTVITLRNKYVRLLTEQIKNITH